MRYMVGAQMGWMALPIIILAFVAYVWVADRLVNRKQTTGQTMIEAKATETKAA